MREVDDDAVAQRAFADDDLAAPSSVSAPIRTAFPADDDVGAARVHPGHPAALGLARAQHLLLQRLEPLAPQRVAVHALERGPARRRVERGQSHDRPRRADREVET